MSFSADVKEELNNNLSLKNKEFLKAELLGYLISNNTTINKGKKYSNISYVTENEFNIEHLYKILVNLNIAYDPEIKGKTFVALIEDFDLVKLEQLFETNKSELKKVILRGCFLGAGSINDPTKNYHAEIKLKNIAKY